MRIIWETGLCSKMIQSYCQPQFLLDMVENAPALAISVAAVDRSDSNGEARSNSQGKVGEEETRASGLSSHSTHVFTWEWGWHMKKMMRWQLIVSLHFQPLAAVDCNLVPIVGSSSWREGAAQFKETRIIRQVDQEQLYLLFLTTTKIQMKTIVFDSISFWLGTEITSYKYSKQIRWKNCM